MTTDARFDGTGPDAAWQENVAAGRFTVQRCTSCDHAQFPPSVLCRACGSSSVSFVEASGRATVYSATTVRKREGAYNVSIVELAEGPRMMSRVEGIEPDEVAIGAAVVARIVAVEDRHIVVFEPEAGR